MPAGDPNISDLDTDKTAKNGSLDDKKSESTATYEDVDETLEDVLYARHAEIKTFEDLEKQRGTSIPALFNQLYKFVQNPSSVSVETYKRMVDTCDSIGSGTDFLTTALAARFGRYVHADPEITKFVNKALEGIEGGWINLLKELLSATWAGFSVAEIVWANKEEGFVPGKVVALPPNTILFETERTGEVTSDGILQYQRNYNPFIQGNGFFSGSTGAGFSGGLGNKPDPFAKLGDFPFPIRTANAFNYLSIRIPKQKCIHYPFNAQGQFGNPYGRSLLRRAYKYYVMEDAILQMMMIALDRKGTALTVVYCDPNAILEKDEGDPSATADLQTFRNKAGKGIRADFAAKGAFKNIHNDSVIILPGKKGEVYSVDFMPQASNVGDFIAAAEFCKKSKVRALLIPSLIFANGDGTGSFALGQTHVETFDKICDSINSGLEHILLYQLIRQIIAYNFPKSLWQKDGMGGFSKKSLTRDEISKEMEVYEKGINTGIIDQNDLNDLNKMRDTIGFEPRDTIIEPPIDPLADPSATGDDPSEEETDEPAPKEKKKLWAKLTALFK